MGKLVDNDDLESLKTLLREFAKSISELRSENDTLSQIISVVAETLCAERQDLRDSIIARLVDPADAAAALTPRANPETIGRFLRLFAH